MPEGADLYVHRVHRDNDMIEKFLQRNSEFEKLIQEKIEVIKKRMK
jgi:hypothetical protein